MILVKDNKYKIVVPSFGAAYPGQIFMGAKLFIGTP